MQWQMRLVLARHQSSFATCGRKNIVKSELGSPLSDNSKTIMFITNYKQLKFRDNFHDLEEHFINSEFTNLYMKVNKISKLWK